MNMPSPEMELASFLFTRKQLFPLVICQVAPVVLVWYDFFLTLPDEVVSWRKISGATVLLFFNRVFTLWYQTGIAVQMLSVSSGIRLLGDQESPLTDSTRRYAEVYCSGIPPDDGLLERSCHRVLMMFLALRMYAIHPGPNRWVSLAVMVVCLIEPAVSYYHQTTVPLASLGLSNAAAEIQSFCLQAMRYLR
ncbi:hypothetical protein EIP91_001845 [Steccherinum ochraceum]|uniref:DUF6533 domain-containing protein n=1 Tax=Steccherinum ochraceum TaxID=92696 RepID=A0A4V2MWF7_9APHY|nr:hypothetical protein EIP91_001845 [Steccherinum ochraceum]